MVALGREKGFKDHIKKPFLAAIGTQTTKFGIANIFEGKVSWPLTHVILAAWSTEIKNNPHFAKQADVFSPEVIQYILLITPMNLRELTDQLFTIITSYTGMRCIDAHSILSRGTTMIPSKLLLTAVYQPRRWQFILETIKNDRKGDGK